MRIALAQLDHLIGDLDAARAAISEAARRAVAVGAELLVCPELATLGYPPRDLLDRRRLVGEQWAMVASLARELPLPAVIGCVEPLAGGLWPGLANAAAVIEGGALRAVYRKRLLPTYDVFDEGRYFEAGARPLVISLAGRRVAVTICEDIWRREQLGFAYRDDPLAGLAGNCDLMVNLAASPYNADKPVLRRRLVADTARALGCPVVYVNQVGGHDELLFDGDSHVVDAAGRWLGGVGRWCDGVAVVDCAGPACAPPKTIEPIADLHAALLRGIRDYCRKTGQRRVVLGLSGGIDSAVVAVLAAQALGPEAVSALLMPGPYSSPGSIADAEALAANLGLDAHLCPIGAANEAVLATLQAPFADLPANVAEENIQARLRGVLVMALANKHGAMALTTGNKSELAVGYCTIYGDMNGGLAPIGDVWKSRVYELANFLNREQELIPHASINKPPSAELRADQKDSDNLGEYPVLDGLLKAYLEEDQGPADLVRAGHDPDFVRRIVRLVEASEFKRRQAAPALRVTVKAFGVGRRMPLARRLES